MKKFVFALFFLLSFNVAANSYDGIYTANINNLTVEFVSIHENPNGTVIAVVVDPNPENSWIALSGTRNGQTAVLESVVGVGVDVIINVTVNFSDSGNHTALINSCIDGVFYTCKFPSGLLLNLSRIF
ncbi:hypothetical protein [Nitrosomonas marina]|uniref:Uncharacterized protein n=1 Tax=Nitrosomonas marina TaxID=917 RepID=A0A1H8FEZ7_9PROT|nr:hypothetical protein [Nitrosomonas marina]SEN30309.1 hypothetical protein SAMN05216325_1139 [Nitrosomonas marina]